MDNFTTMITPYKKNGSIDYETAEKYVDWYFENNLTGIFSICQSSEIFYLSLEEKVELNSRVYTRAKALERESGKTFTVVSSGHTSDTLDFGRQRRRIFDVLRFIQQNMGKRFIAVKLQKILYIKSIEPFHFLRPLTLIALATR